MKRNLPLILNSDSPQPALYRYNSLQEKLASIFETYPDKKIRDKYITILSNLEVTTKKLKEFLHSIYQDVLINDQDLSWSMQELAGIIDDYHDLLDMLEKSENCNIVKDKKSVLKVLGEIQ